MADVKGKQSQGNPRRMMKQSENKLSEKLQRRGVKTIE